MTNPEIKKALLTSGTQFKTNTTFSEDQVFEMDRFTEQLSWEQLGQGMSVRSGMLDSMNVEVMGDDKITLYSYNMLGIRSTAVVKFEDITIIEVGSD